ncbi:MAG: glycosyltransferase family 1 protein [Lachnospira sp.]|nr:glycosyltransferase family 1 protein [Lachnospira sp.]
MKKIRVLHFELDENLGGIETFLLNLYKQIDRDNVQFEFVTTAKEAALEEQFLSLGGIIHHVSAHSDIINYYKDVKKLLKSGVDVVHVHKNSAANIVPLLLSKQCGMKKIFVHSHNTAPSIGGVSKILHKINKPYLNKIATKKFACSTQAGNWLFLNDSFEVLSNGIITDNFQFDNSIRERKRKELQLDKNTILIGNIGRFTPQKNQKRAVDIFEVLHSKLMNTKMILVGNGEFMESVSDYIISKNLEKDIFLLGVRYDIPELLMAMDAFLMPSLYEGLPIVSIEAQAAGLPMFLSDTISPETEITDAVSWFALKDSNQKVADTITKVLQTNQYNRAKLLEQVIAKGYDMKTTAIKMLNYYKE